VFFTVFMALFVIFLNVLWWNLPNVLQHITSSEIRILNTKKVGFVKAGFSMFSNFTAAKKLSYRFPWKTSSDWSKLFTTNLPNFTEFDRRKRKKIHCQFCFLCSCWRHKYEICDFSFYFVCSCWRHQKHWRSPSSARRLLELSSSARVRS